MAQKRLCVTVPQTLLLEFMRWPCLPHFPPPTPCAPAAPRMKPSSCMRTGKTTGQPSNSMPSGSRTSPNCPRCGYTVRRSSATVRSSPAPWYATPPGTRVLPEPVGGGEQCLRSCIFFFFLSWEIITRPCRCVLRTFWRKGCWGWEQMSQAVLARHQQAPWSGPCRLTPEPGFPIFKDRVVMSNRGPSLQRAGLGKMKAITGVEMLWKS